MRQVKIDFNKNWVKIEIFAFFINLWLQLSKLKEIATNGLRHIKVLKILYKTKL